MRRALLASTALSIVAAIAVACGSSDDDATPSPDAGSTSSSSGDSASPDDAGGASSSSSSSGGPTGIYVPAQPGAGTAYCDNTLGKLLAKLPQCCSADDQQSQEYRLGAGILTLALQSCGPRFERAIAAGRLAIDEGAAADCYGAYDDFVGKACVPGGSFGLDPKAATDPVLTQRLKSCESIFRGNVAENGACVQDVDCVDGLTCVGYTASSDGVCKQPPAINEACGEGESDAGFTVALNAKMGVHPKCVTGAYCSVRMCREQADPGETCFSDDQCAGGKKCHNRICGDDGDSDENGSCKSNEDCKTGLYCQGTNGGAQLGTCQPKLADGATCTTTLVNPECKGRCDKPDGSDTGTCKSLCGSG